MSRNQQFDVIKMLHNEHQEVQQCFARACIFIEVLLMDDKGKISGQQKLPGNGKTVELLKVFGETMFSGMDCCYLFFMMKNAEQ
jgi:hypothetical protein